MAPTPAAKRSSQPGPLRKLLNYRPDFLIVAILTAVVVALLFPVRGQAADVADVITKRQISVGQSRGPSRASTSKITEVAT